MTPQTDAEGFVRRAMNYAHSFGLTDNAEERKRETLRFAAELAAMLDTARAEERAELNEWKRCCQLNNEELERWYAAARHYDVPKWDGKKYSSIEEWFERIAASIRARGERKEIC